MSEERILLAVCNFSLNLLRKAVEPKHLKYTTNRTVQINRQNGKLNINKSITKEKCRKSIVTIEVLQVKCHN